MICGPPNIYVTNHQQSQTNKNKNQSIIKKQAVVPVLKNTSWTYVIYKTGNVFSIYPMEKLYWDTANHSELVSQLKITRYQSLYVVIVAGGEQKSHDGCVSTITGNFLSRVSHKRLEVKKNYMNILENKTFAQFPGNISPKFKSLIHPVLWSPAHFVLLFQFLYLIIISLQVSTTAVCTVLMKPFKTTTGDSFDEPE